LDAAQPDLQDSIAPLRRTPYLGQVILIATVYFAAAKLSLLLAIPPGYASAVWPSSGIALAAVLLLGNRVWPGIWIGAAAVNYTVNGSSSLSALIGVGNLLEALVGAALIRRSIGLPYRFDRGEDVVRFVVIAASSSTVAATSGVGSLAVFGSVSSSEFLQNWFTWWGGDTVGVIIMTPLALSWSARDTTAVWPWTKRIEGACFGLLLVAVAWVIFGSAKEQLTVFPLVFVIVPFIIWAAFRFRQREVTLTNMATCSIAIWYTVGGRGPFASASLNETLLLLLAFVSTVVTTGLVLSAVERQRRRTAGELQGALRDLEEQAIRDPMTGLYNRRYLRDFLLRELLRSRRAEAALAVIMMDLDQFKQVNDTFGHDAGDIVLMEVTTVLRNSVRGSDMVCRFGGEEFVLVLTDSTAEVALRRCEEIRSALRLLQPKYQGRALGNPTASFGVALFPYHADDHDSLIKASDSALYDAKRSGRDRIAISSTRVVSAGST
jgi:diguanylate cyclase (GGDEF)-like protein